VVSSTHRPYLTLGKDPVPISQEAGWAPGPVWTGGKSRPHRDSIPEHPACSQSLYRLSYRAHPSHLSIFNNSIVFIMCNSSGGYYYCYSSLNFLSEGSSENYTLSFTRTRLNKSKRETLLLMGVHANKGPRAQLVQVLR